MFDDELDLPFANHVTRWQTKDGVLHESSDDVEKHIVTTLENAIGPIIDDANKGLNPAVALGSKAKLAIIDALIGTPSKAKQLKDILDRLV